MIVLYTGKISSPPQHPLCLSGYTESCVSHTWAARTRRAEPAGRQQGRFWQVWYSLSRATQHQCLERMPRFLSRFSQRTSMSKRMERKAQMCQLRLQTHRTRACAHAHPTALVDCAEILSLRESHLG